MCTIAYKTGLLAGKYPMAEYWGIGPQWSPCLFVMLISRLCTILHGLHASRYAHVCRNMKQKHTVCHAYMDIHGHTRQTGHTWHTFLLCIIIISLFGGMKIKCIKNIYHNYGKDGAVSLLQCYIAYIQLYLYIHSGYHSIQDRPSGWKIPHGWVLRRRGKMKSLPFCDAYFKAL